MKKIVKACACMACSAMLWLGCNSSTPTPTAASEVNTPPDTIGTVPYTIELEKVAQGLTAPVCMATPPHDNSVWYICEQQGVIRMVKNNVLVAQPFLDIRHKIDELSVSYSEKGLLGMAFHPQYSSNGKFYIYYSEASDVAGSNHKSVIAEYVVAGNHEVDVQSERILLEIEQPESNHNGGMLAFGGDGYLYIGSGDGGGGGDHHGTIGNGQNKNNLLGKILRIDVDGKMPYAIPDDNPFVNGGGRAEIYAWGLRNPWRFSFDKASGAMWCGDVGQNLYEEVDIIERGKNYGWRMMEGYHCYDNETCDRVGLTYPVHEYSHTVGRSVCGGYVYRGSFAPAQGHYIFGDYDGKIFALIKNGNAWQRHNLLTVNDGVHDLLLNSFGEDGEGELYVMVQHQAGPFDRHGELFKINWVAKK